MLGLSRQRVDQLSRERHFPEAWRELRTGRVWRDTDIEQWARDTGRTLRQETTS